MTASKVQVSELLSEVKLMKQGGLDRDCHFKITCSHCHNLLVRYISDILTHLNNCFGKRRVEVRCSSQRLLAVC